MENQGKEAERKAVQATLEKIRKASKGEILSLLPFLQTQISMLMNLEEMSDSFKGELEDIMAQLGAIIQESGPLQATTEDSPSSPLKRTGSMSPVNSSASSDKLASRSPSLAAPLSPKSTRKNSAMFGAASTTKGKTSDGLQSNGSAVDLKRSGRCSAASVRSCTRQSWVHRGSSICTSLQTSSCCRSMPTLRSTK